MKLEMHFIVFWPFKKMKIDFQLNLFNSLNISFSITGIPTNTPSTKIDNFDAFNFWMPSHVESKAADFHFHSMSVTGHLPRWLAVSVWPTKGIG